MPTTWNIRTKNITSWSTYWRFKRFKDYIRGIDNDGDVLVCDSLWNRIVIFSDSWFEEVWLTDWTKRVEI